jgi:hypothetical protein
MAMRRNLSICFLVVMIFCFSVSAGEIVGNIVAYAAYYQHQWSCGNGQFVFTVEKEDKSRSQAVYIDLDDSTLGPEITKGIMAVILNAYNSKEKVRVVYHDTQDNPCSTWTTIRKLMNIKSES